MVVKSKRLALLAVAALGLVGGALSVTAQPVSGVEPGARYVAMGSSYAAGPGIATPVESAPARCWRSSENYAHQLARNLRLTLVDQTCSGATTEAVLTGWAELPPQIEAVNAETRLVTVTIGGNDVGYVPNMLAAACHKKSKEAHALPKGGKCPKVALPTEETWIGLEGRMRQLARDIRVRAPNARLIFVDYPVVLPQDGNCPTTFLSDKAADEAREVARRLGQVTAAVAQEYHADLFRASEATQGHDACARDPWMNGYRAGVPGGRPIVPFHPTLAGMTAVADGLIELLRRGPATADTAARHRG